MLKIALIGVVLCMFSKLNGNIVFPHSHEERSFNNPVYSVVKPREEGFLKVSDLHSIFYTAYGNPNGIPVVVLHGGPGAGCSDSMVQSFDLTKWNVVMFDQRGAMRSLPFGCMEENTPQDLVGDIEKLREHLRIKQWVIFGGSWGSSLALLYGQEHPENCLGFILRGVWLVREADYLHLFYGMGKIFPEAYQEMVDHIPEKERGDLLSAYYRRVFDSNPEVQLLAARAFMKFDAICATLLPNPKFVEAMLQNDQLVLGVMKSFCHYAKNGFFLRENQILSNMERIAHLPAIIVQGRYDAICLHEMAYSLHQSWSNSLLWMIPDGGHSASNPSVGVALAAATDLFAEKIINQ
jgi:proline iminopeptidase